MDCSSAACSRSRYRPDAAAIASVSAFLRAVTPAYPSLWFAHRLAHELCDRQTHHRRCAADEDDPAAQADDSTHRTQRRTEATVPARDEVALAAAPVAHDLDGFLATARVAL